MNRIVLLGRLTRDPEVRYSAGAEPIAIAKYSLAVNRRFKKEGEPDADFINCTALGKGGEFAERFFKKGMMVCVSGRLQISNYDDKQTGQKKQWVEVVVDEQDFAESKASFEARSGAQSGGVQPNASSGGSGGYQNKNIKPTSNKISEPEGFYPIEEGIEEEDFPF